MSIDVTFKPVPRIQTNWGEIQDVLEDNFAAIKTGFDSTINIGTDLDQEIVSELQQRTYNECIVVSSIPTTSTSTYVKNSKTYNFVLGQVIKCTADNKFYRLANISGTTYTWEAIGAVDTSNLVTLDGTQTITGAKVFSNTLTTNNIVLSAGSTITKASNSNTNSIGTSAGPITNIFATTFTGSLSGNASSSTKLAIGRTISLTGPITGTSATFDGTANVSISTSLNTSDSNITGNFVLLSGNQTIAGTKTFSNTAIFTTGITTGPILRYGTSTTTDIGTSGNPFRNIYGTLVGTASGLTQPIALNTTGVLVTDPLYPVIQNGNTTVDIGYSFSDSAMVRQNGISGVSNVTSTGTTSQNITLTLRSSATNYLVYHNDTNASGSGTEAAITQFTMNNNGTLDTTYFEFNIIYIRIVPSATSTRNIGFVPGTGAGMTSLQYQNMYVGGYPGVSGTRSSRIIPGTDVVGVGYATKMVIRCVICTVNGVVYFFANPDDKTSTILRASDV